ncbi:MAG: hypothetical protein KF760_33230 [Candidatus Eremiobacteraeota bacterium]|nr:hypothetical protein [Candidatus Eremiobacteraeota bacterium]MCW5869069.1 hypothetical protein [Candidatus Eremiobacteraeota bacterium]
MLKDIQGRARLNKLAELIRAASRAGSVEYSLVGECRSLRDDLLRAAQEAKGEVAEEYLQMAGILDRLTGDLMNYEFSAIEEYLGLLDLRESAH